MTNSNPTTFSLLFIILSKFCLAIFKSAGVGSNYYLPFYHLSLALYDNPPQATQLASVAILFCLYSFQALAY